MVALSLWDNIKNGGLGMKTIILLMCMLVVTACSDKSKVISTTDTDNFENALGLINDNSIDIDYKRSENTVTISSADQSGNPIPISFWGVRVNTKNHSEVKKFCSLLGFYDPDASSVISVVKKPYVDIENSGFFGDWRNLSYLRYPVFHMSLFSNETGNTLFEYVSKLSSSFFSDPIVNTEAYAQSIECKGVSDVHLAEDGTFVKEEFLKNIFKKQFADEIEMGKNAYSQGHQFLVAKAEDIWQTKNPESSQAYGSMKRDSKIMDLAQEGAEDICVKSNYHGVLFYTLKYLHKDQMEDQVYSFNSDNNLWSEDLAPKKHIISSNYFDGYVDVEHKVEVPSVFLDLIYCL